MSRGLLELRMKGHFVNEECPIVLALESHGGSECFVPAVRVIIRVRTSVCFITPWVSDLVQPTGHIITVLNFESIEHSKRMRINESYTRIYTVAVVVRYSIC